MKAKLQTYSMYPDTIQQISDIVEFKKDPSYKKSKVIREAVEAFWLRCKSELNDKRHEEGALNE